MTIINVHDHGAAGDGSADDTSAIQAAIDAGELLHSAIIFFPSGTYKITTGLRVRSGVLLEGSGYGDESPTATQPDQPGTAIVWGGGSTGTDPMILVKGGSGNYVFGFGLDQISLKGQNAAFGGLHMASTRQSHVGTIWVERCRSYHVLYDDGNSLLSAGNVIDDLIFTAGTNAATANANGLVVRSAFGTGCTQMIVHRVAGRTQDNDAIILGDLDSSFFGHVQVGASGAGAHGLRFRGLTDGQTRVSRKIYVAWFAEGSVLAETDSRNVIGWINSEGTSVIQEPGAVLHYNIIDRQNGKRYRSFAYKHNDLKHLQAESGYAVEGAPALSTLGTNSVRGVALGPSSAQAWQWTFTSPREWDFGRLEKVVINGAPASTNTGAVVFRVSFQSRPLGTGLNAALVTENITHTVSAAIVYERIEIDLTPLNIALHSMQIIRLTRLGGNAGDTFPDDYFVFGIEVQFRARAGLGDGDALRYEPTADVNTL